MKNESTNRGITLISLIITIVILLILVIGGISLTINDGIVQKAKEGENQYIIEEEIKKIELGLIDYKTVKLTRPSEAILKIDGTSSIEGNEIDGWKVVFEETGNEYDVKYDGTIQRIESEEPIIGYANEWEYIESDKSIKYIGTWTAEKGDTFVIPNYWKESENSTELKKVLKVTALNTSVQNTANLKLQISNGIQVY